jgi:hypothetical protein
MAAAWRHGIEIISVIWRSVCGVNIAAGWRLALSAESAMRRSCQYVFIGSENMKSNKWRQRIGTI